jgi:dihydropteroate synthase
MAATFAGIDLTAPVVMGIINVTPDSFSDGGEVFAHEQAVKRGLKMVANGAKILDIGGESTRPGAEPVSIDEEIRRVVPVIKALKDSGASLSIDTRNPDVMQAAVDAGADIINDVTALTHQDNSVTVASSLGVPVILMHMKGNPKNMQQEPHYDDAPQDVAEYLKDRVERCVASGIPKSNIALDPGIGFGKTVEHNLQILARIEEQNGSGCPIVLGVSRKSFIGKVTGTNDPQARLSGSIASAVLARQRGVQIFRVHDVAETVEALCMVDAIQQHNI